jgi:hypothetical protein
MMSHRSNMSNHKIYTVRQASAMLKISQSQIKRLIFQNAIAVIPGKQDFLITKSELTKYKEKHARSIPSSDAETTESLPNKEGMHSAQAQDSNVAATSE